MIMTSTITIATKIVNILKERHHTTTDDIQHKNPNNTNRRDNLSDVLIDLLVLHSLKAVGILNRPDHRRPLLRDAVLRVVVDLRHRAQHNAVRSKEEVRRDVKSRLPKVPGPVLEESVALHPGVASIDDCDVLCILRANFWSVAYVNFESNKGSYSC